LRDTYNKATFNKPNAKAVWRYATRPEIIPRIRALSFHLGHFAFLIANILSSTKLIPHNHPCVSAQNIGQYSVRQVLGLAANNITWSWKHSDQIAIFCAVVIGLALLAVQAVLIAFAAMVGFNPAHASGTSYFSTPSENVPTDVVLIFLEQVFGANLDFFGAASQPLGTPVYSGLQSMLGIYSMATMVIAVVIVLYYVLTVVGETAKTGTPFGGRFNSLWAPIRLVVALGLLIPLGSGLNSAQYITLWAAKAGSGLGTLGWTTFVQEVTAATDIVAKPAGESTAALVQRIFLNEVCAAAFNQIEEGNGRSIEIVQQTGRRSSQVADFSNPAQMIDRATGRNQKSVVLAWSNGEHDRRAIDTSCGRISIAMTEFDVFADGDSVYLDEERWWWNMPLIGRDMSDHLGRVHKDLKSSYISEIGRLSVSLRPAAEAIAKVSISINARPERGQLETLDFIPDLLKEQARLTHDNINASILATYESITQSEYATSGGYDEMVNRGWGAAGLWYGTLGTINQKYMDAVASAIPTLDVLFSAKDVRDNERTSVLGLYFSVSQYGLNNASTLEIENAINTAADFMGVVEDVVPTASPLYEDARFEEASEAGESGWLSNTILWIFGGNQLRNLKNDPSLDPMVRLVSVGHRMVNRSIGAAGFGTAFGIGGAIASAVPNPKAKFIGELASAASGLLFAFAAIGFTAGVFLAYILPIIPFVYFAFAVIGWVLEVFEAVVAMPLWAMAHLRIDGDGMPGGAALGGYQLLLMIILRPILIVFGLIGGYVLFGAAVFFLSTLFNAATVITQSDIAPGSMGALSVFIYTLVFTFLVYNIALMCFKMVDDVPKGMLRWLGASVSPFSDSRGDAINGAREVLIGAAAGASVIRGGISSTSKNVKQANLRKKKRDSGVDPDTGDKINPTTGNPL